MLLTINVPEILWLCLSKGQLLKRKATFLPSNLADLVNLDTCSTEFVVFFLNKILLFSQCDSMKKFPMQLLWSNHTNALFLNAGKIKREKYDGVHFPSLCILDYRNDSGVWGITLCYGHIPGPRELWMQSLRRRDSHL